jgi:phenylalanyl-tRNA synthetase beta chain
VDPSTTVEHVERITQLVRDICGGEAGPMDDQTLALPERKPVLLRVARAVKVIGMPLTQERCADALRCLGLDVTEGEGEGTVTVVPPAFRFALQIEEDLIEEVARIVGYEQLPQSPPIAPITPKWLTESQRGPFAVRRHLAHLGYQETINYSFVESRWEVELAGNADPVKLQNPISSQMGVMRSSLLGSLIAALKFNLDRKVERVRLFEIGRVFFKDASVKDSDTTVAGFRQPMRVAALAYGPMDAVQWGVSTRGADFFDAKGDVQALLAPLQVEFRVGEHPAMHPGRCATVWHGDACIGHVGELHPRWRQVYELAQAPVMFELALDAVLARDVPVFKAVSRYQPVERDLAIVVKESVTHESVMAAIMSVESNLLRDALLFDVYRPKKAADAFASGGLAADEKSLAVRLCFTREDATLTDAEVDAVVKSALTQLELRVMARLRA